MIISFGSYNEYTSVWVDTTIPMTTTTAEKEMKQLLVARSIASMYIHNAHAVNYGLLPT